MNKRYYEHTLPIIRGSLSNTYGETCHFQFQGPVCGPPPQARFSGKIPEHGEDDFPRNLQGPTLQVATGGSATFAPELG